MTRIAVPYQDGQSYFGVRKENYYYVMHPRANLHTLSFLSKYAPFAIEAPLF